MTKTPIITIFVRHAADCKYVGDEFCRRCKCRKHFRWTANGTQYRRAAGTRSWEDAEKSKRDLEDQFSGKTAPKDDARPIQEAVTLFLQDRTVQGVTAPVIARYDCELTRLREYCEKENVFTVQGITRELLTGYCATWRHRYGSSLTQANVRMRCRSFLRYCYEAQWLPRIPPMPKIKADEPPTLPLTADEYARLLAAVDEMPEPPRLRIRALFQIMRHSGLAIKDALRLERSSLHHDAAGGLYRVVTSRQKTGTHVSVPIPPHVARDIQAAPGSKYFAWDGLRLDGTLRWYRQKYIAPAFKAAGIEGGHMMSHRLRDTFAVDLLTKGVPLEEVSKLLGHESIKTTEKHYSKWMKGRQDRLDSLVTATWAVTEKRRK